MGHHRYLRPSVRRHIKTPHEGAAEKLLRGSLGGHWRMIPLQVRKDCRSRVARLIQEVRNWRAAYKRDTKDEG